MQPKLIPAGIIENLSINGAPCSFILNQNYPNPFNPRTFINKKAEKYGNKTRGLKAETITYLENYAWPGNVRELENAIERMVILVEEHQDYLPIELLPKEIISSSLEFPFPLLSNQTSESVKTMKDTYEKKCFWKR